MTEQILRLLNDTLNNDFARDQMRKRNRKIIFWYDSKREYEEFILNLAFKDTEIIIYDNNSFWIRYHVEIEELNKNIIIYFPFERKKDIDNDLLDLETANADLFFNPDLTTIRLNNLNLNEDCRSLISKYFKFFGNKKRELEFINFDLEKNKDNIDLVVTAILLNIKSINEDDILKEIIKFYFDDKKKYEELFKFGSETFILGLFNETFGLNLESYLELPEIYKALVFTYFAISLKDMKALNRYGNYLLTKKSTNVYVFANNLMRDKTTKKYFEKIAMMVEKEFGIGTVLEKMDIDDYITSDAFFVIDKFIIKYLVKKIMINIGDYEICDKYITIRENKYWFEKLYNEYNVLRCAILFQQRVNAISSFLRTIDLDKFVKDYVNNLWEVDTLYRKFYFYYDNILDKDMFIDLKNKVENIYVNDFMSKLSIKWSNMIADIDSYNSSNLILQNNFYKTFVKPFNDKKDRIIVIISDAFRYECANELNTRLKEFASKSDILYMLGLLPSYTKLGMAALLPNEKLSKVNKDDILVDGISSGSLKNRQLILQKENPESMAIKYEELYDMTKMEWKKLFSGKKIVYIYHNTIDSIGEHNENDIFLACDKAINELEKLVRDLHTTFSGINAFITTDHGFFYKRGKIEDYEKTDRILNAKKQKTRYSFSDDKVVQEGILSISLEYLFGKNSGYVSIPRGNTVFSRQGAGINYVHGGLLPQEIIIPVINFKSTRTSDDSKNVGITYSGLSKKITNIITYLEFIQDSNVDCNHKPCRYLLHFEDESGVKISDECTIIANYKNTNVKDRFFKEKFVFKNMRYDKNRDYFLVIIDEKTGLIKEKIKFYIDIVITNEFDY